MNGDGRNGIARNVVIIGLDGASFDYILPLIDAGKLPNLAALIKGGTRAGMTSTYPPYSAPAWISFMTGENPGRHGIFEFWTTDLTSYNPLAGERLVTSHSYQGRTIFDIVGKYGPVAALRVPVTFPPWEIPGVMVSGYPSRYGSEGTVWPPHLSEIVTRPESGKRRLLTRYRGSQEEMHLDMNREQLDLLTQLAIDVLDSGDHKLFMVVYNQLDSVCHHFIRHSDPDYPTYEPRRSPSYSGVIQEMHERLDAAVGEILKRVDDESLIVIMSDHGMGPRARNQIHLNAWLASLGLLKVRRRGGLLRENISKTTNFLVENLPIRQELRRFLPKWVKGRVTESLLNVRGISWNETLAYRVRMLPPIEGIEINLKGRQPQGAVDPSEYDQWRDYILEQLSSLRDPATGEPLVIRAYRREELHEGPNLDRAPDILLELKPDYEAGVRLKPPIVTPTPKAFLKMRSGGHTMTGIAIARGPHVRRGELLDSIELRDLAPTILYYLGLPVPENMDGRVVTEIFDPEFVASRTVTRGAALVTGGAGGGISNEEEESMRQQLRGLGYL